MEKHTFSWNAWNQAAAFAALFTIALVPLFSVSVPPLVDYPNHLARMYVLFQADGLEPISHFYAADWKLLPNLAMEGVMPLLLWLFPLEVAGKVFVGLTLLLLASGTLALHYALSRRLSPWPLVVFLILYNRIFLWGFVNYLFALGLALWVFAAWIHWHGRGLGFRTMVFTVLGLVVYFAHLYAFGIYALSVAAYEAGRLEYRAWWASLRREWRSWFPAAISLGIPVVVFMLLSPTSEGAGVFQYGRLMRKVAGLVSLFNDYDRVVDAVTILLVAAIGVAALWSRKLVVRREMWLPLAVLAIAYLAMPATLFTSHGSDVRFAPALAAIFIGATEIRDLPRRWWAGVATVLLVVFIGRMAVIQGYWLRSDAQYSEFLSAFSQLPPGSRLFTAEGETVEWQPFPTPTAHLPCMAVIRQGVFVPSLFAYPTQQPIRLRGEYASIARAVPEVIYKDDAPVPWEHVLRHYTHVLVIATNGPIEVPRSGLVVLRRSGQFVLYKVAPARANRQTIPVSAR